MKKLLLLLPLMFGFLFLTGCFNNTKYICNYVGKSEVAIIVKEKIESQSHICGCFSGYTECFDRKLCEEIE